MKKQDITTLEDIQILVNEFYTKIRQDDMLKDIFNKVIEDRWAEHLEKMVRFWQTVLLDNHTYHGSPFTPHAFLPVNKSHFEKWIFLFSETVDEHFAGEKAEQAKWQGQRMAEMFNLKIEYYRDSSVDPIL